MMFHTLRSHTGSFLSHHSGTWYPCSQYTLDRETFKAGPIDGYETEQIAEDRIALRVTGSSHYVSVNPDNTVKNRDKTDTGPQAWEIFDVLPLNIEHPPQHYLDELTNRGWTLVPVFTAEEARALKLIVSNIEGGDEVEASGKLQVRKGQIASRHPALLQAAINPLLQGLMLKYLKEAPCCATFSSNTLLQQNGQGTDCGLGWHVDYPYHDIPHEMWPSADKPLGVQVLYLLDDFSAANGGTLFRTGTHTLGRQPDYDDATPRATATMQCEQLGEMPSVLPPGFVADPNIAKYHRAPAGSVLLAHSAWHHRQVRNVASSGGSHPRRRTALLGNYTPNFVVPKSDMRKYWDSICSTAKDWETCELTDRDRTVIKHMWLGHKQGHHRGGSGKDMSR